MTLALTSPNLAGQLFATFAEGHAAYQARDEFAEQIGLRETSLVSVIRNGALGGIDQLETSLLTPSDHPDLALDSLRLIADKARLERTDQRLAAGAREIADLFMGREVRIKPVDSEARPIARFYYSGGLAGSRQYEPSPVHRQRAHGKITGIDRRHGLLWVTSKVGTGRIGRFLGDAPYRWRVAMPTESAEEPLVHIDFVE